MWKSSFFCCQNIDATNNEIWSCRHDVIEDVTPHFLVDNDDDNDGGEYDDGGL